MSNAELARDLSKAIDLIAEAEHVLLDITYFSAADDLNILCQRLDRDLKAIPK
jgi:hypothetical protein